MIQLHLEDIARAASQKYEMHVTMLVSKFYVLLAHEVVSLVFHKLLAAISEPAARP
jgi:hypothetical protein